MRRVVCSVSSNVQLPVLPEARMEIRNAMRQSWAASSVNCEPTDVLSFRRAE